MISEEEVKIILADVGAVITDSHIVYTSGKHGSAYINKDAVYTHTRYVWDLAKALAQKFYLAGADTVIAPAVGAVILGHLVASQLTKMNGKGIFSVYADKDGNDNFVIKRGYNKFIAGKKVLIIEDVLTTGGSVHKVVEAVRADGGEVVAVGTLCNRGGVLPKDIGDVPELFALLNITLDAWDEPNCPLCAQSVPINTTIGKGKEYLAKKQVNP